MSHLVDGDCSITNLDALDAACGKLGLELIRNQATYKWFGRFVGDSPLPPGLKIEDLGKCEHAIRIKGAPADAYEIGLVRRRDGQPGWTLAFDSWGHHGRALEKVAGKGLRTLMIQHHVATAEQIYGNEWIMEPLEQPDGRVRVRMWR
jgi:hypothetical protein